MTSSNGTIRPITFLFAAILGYHLAIGQTSSKEKMAQLDFMIGDWEGLSTSYGDTGKKQVKAHELVQYRVDEHVITLDLDSESLKLHTVIYYDEKDGTYYYCPFYKKGRGQYKGLFTEGRFRVDFNENRRLWFQLTPEGYFHEYGEKRIDGKWTTYFEDILPPKKALQTD